MSPRILHPPVSDLSSALARTASLPRARVSALGVEQADPGAVGRTSRLRSAAPFNPSAVDCARRTGPRADATTGVGMAPTTVGSDGRRAHIIAIEGRESGRRPAERRVITVLDVQLALARNFDPKDPSFADFLRASMRAQRAGQPGSAKAYGVLAMRIVDVHLAEFHESSAASEARL